MTDVSATQNANQDTMELDPFVGKTALQTSEMMELYVVSPKHMEEVLARCKKIVQETVKSKAFFTTPSAVRAITMSDAAFAPLIVLMA
jgi:hypothetical protein